VVEKKILIRAEYTISYMNENKTVFFLKQGKIFISREKRTHIDGFPLALDEQSTYRVVISFVKAMGTNCEHGQADRLRML
jgi:hypothetical protein